ncbi:MAG: hypothetical protein A2151_08165 [Candidatus Muproteobacteria bacterium RBG_16_65_34]|uniref:N-acetylmuramoyl-L-alanine amidase n=1 Tax=Candidatus Muproteobacteria bacterium RBG_16_65_34 TaxID=1817760 RepID=A0A1F6TT40_9PROT|nr:MAG: hypothetical protein A2151_08165 [Candidatus Muproteobacteria bacterium RBG_16_65_34]
MKTARRVFFLLLVLTPAAQAAPVTVQNLRVYSAPDNTRIVFDLSGPLEHRLFQLQDPQRIVIDMDNARLEGALPETGGSGPVLAALRMGAPEAGRLRFVLDLKVATRPRTFVLKPAGPYGHRLVIDLFDVQVLEQEQQSAGVAEPRAARPAEPEARREFVVAIDAGHGGDDPGAIGRRHRTREKDVTLAIARELAKLIAQEPGMRPVLIRDGDYFIKLEKRQELAKKRRADVFVSIHADSMPGRRLSARGSSVYAVSERGATNALAKGLADEENAADWIGGVTPEEMDSDVKKILGDLTLTATIADSLALGADMLTALRAIGPLHSATVAQAGFAVLKSPVPSVLVETAFISNPNEERKLRDRAHQRRIAQGILDGLKRAMPRLIARRGEPAGGIARAAPAGGDREHVVQRGETLSSIARQYNVHIEALRFFNRLGDGAPATGARLRIPSSGGDG